jgi:hypothetical protein
VLLLATLQAETHLKLRMTAMSRIRHFGMAVAILFAVHAFAVPVKPNLEKILQQQQQRPRQYEPARAGWDGPEMVRPQDASPNPVYEAYGPASTARAIRASLRTAMLPDPAALTAILMLILLWRIVRQQRTQRQHAPVVAMPQPEIASKESRAA